MLAHLQRNAVSNSCHVSLDCRCWRRHWWCVSKGKRQHWTWLIDAAVTTFWFGLGLAAGAGYVTAIFLFLPRINSGIWLLRSTKHLHFRLCDTPWCHWALRTCSELCLSISSLRAFDLFLFVLNTRGKNRIFYTCIVHRGRRRLSPRKPKFIEPNVHFFCCCNIVLIPSVGISGFLIKILEFFYIGSRAQFSSI
jgi:hypothetical protein